MNWLAGVPDDDEEHFTATAFLNYHLASRGLKVADLAVRPSVVVAFQPYTYRHLVQAAHGEEVEAWSALNRFPLAQGTFDGVPLSIAQLPVGAPAAVMYLEHLAFGGAKTVIAVGSAGSLQEYAPLGAAVLPLSALREEGTSHHYQPAAVEALPDPDCVASLRTACAARGVLAHEGQVWTTDAPYRELTSKVRRLAAGGVVAVDMEASALFIVGAMRALRVGSLFVISDELFHPWAPGFFDRRFREAGNRLAECALAAAAALTKG